MLAEDLNVAAIPICGGVDLRYAARQKVTQLPDATHLLVTQVPAVEWDCFLWNLPKPLTCGWATTIGPTEDGATLGSADSTRSARPPHLRSWSALRFSSSRSHAAGSHADRLHARPAAALVLSALRGQRLDRRLRRAGERLLLDRQAARRPSSGGASMRAPTATSASGTASSTAAIACRPRRARTTSAWAWGCGKATTASTRSWTGP